jgi:hypothetical protein
MEYDKTEKQRYSDKYYNRRDIDEHQRTVCKNPDRTAG